MARIATIRPVDEPPIINGRTSSLDKVTRLTGNMSTDGVADLQVQVEDSPIASPTNDRQPRSMKIALNSIASSDSLTTDSESASEEDYDSLKHDPTTVIAGGHGGGFDGLGGLRKSNIKEERIFEALKPSSQARPQPQRLKSIPITLKKSDQKGRYILTADDSELREILRIGEEKDHAGKSKKRRNKFSDLAFTRQFTAFDRQNSESADSPFHGFFTLFWLGTAIFMVQTAAKNWQLTGNIFGTNDIMHMMFHRDVLVLGLSDGVMFAATGFGFVLQKIIQHGYLSWNKQGWIIQTVWQAIYLGALIEWTLWRQWAWPHTVFFVLHGLVFVMKQHSYAFYNGYLSEAYTTRELLKRRLKQLEEISPVQTPSATNPAASSLSTSYLDHRPTASEMNHRRQSVQMQDSSTDIGMITTAISSGEPLDMEQVQTFERIIKWEIDALTEDIKGKASSEDKCYPNNLTLTNHFEYIVLPTLVYELEYPRSDNINWYYVAEKAAATVGVLLVMMLVSQTFIYPVVVRTVQFKDAGMSLQERLMEFPWILSDLIFPFMLEYMMVWYVIWECILNLLAELTYFADRGFYSDWWNSVSWDQFARDWNRPVHNFLLRHVYHSSISTLKVNKYSATLITFLLSSLVHELVMWCLFRKLRGYLLFFQMLQLPLVAMSRSRFLRGRATLGNLIFWVGIFTGPSLLCSLYLII